MKSFKVVAITTVLGAALIASGCSSAQKGAAGGGLVGGVAGAVVGNNWVSAGPATGAVVGGSSGAAVGGIAGDAYDQVNDKDMERELQNLRAELTDKNDQLAALQGRAPSDEQVAELNDAKTRLQALEADLASARANADQANADRDAANGQLSALSAKQSDADALRSKLDAADAERARLAADTDRASADAKSLRDAIAQKEASLKALQDSLAAKDAQLRDMEGKVNILQTSLTGKQEELSGLTKQLSDMNVKLEQTSRGLTMTIVDSLLYTPGEAEMSDDGKTLVSKVATILKEKFPNRELLVEGHTDNQPIVHSGWRSNWELGAARSLTMLHELNEEGIESSKISATSYGEFRPTNSNATAEGRRLNRRAVIVILPEELPLTRQNLAKAD